MAPGGPAPLREPERPPILLATYKINNSFLPRIRARPFAMTFVLTINTHESIWMLTDRRLSAHGRPHKDDARKTMFLETTDGIAILGYAGLGATAAGSEPADWMSAVLRGRRLTLEQALGVLANAMSREFPPHLIRIPGGDGLLQHNVLVTAYVGDELRFYTIGLVFAPDRNSREVRYTRWVREGTTRTAPLGLGGTGGIYLAQYKKWRRPLLRLVRDYNRGKVSPYAVADHLAQLNHQVHSGLSDNSVGPRCIVAWRHRRGRVHKGGGAHQFYRGIARDPNTLSLPTIAGGLDVTALIGATMPMMMEHLQAMLQKEAAKQLDKDAINALLARLPDKPDERLR
jgi:hypothetical protein